MSANAQRVSVASTPGRSARASRGLARAKRWLLIATIAIAGAFVLYLVAANVILRTHLLRGWLNENETKLRIEYTSAWSAYPGHVVTRDLSLRYQDSNIQMLLEFDRATLRIDMYALTKRVFRARKLSAEGATIRIRPKLETIEGHEGRVRAFSPIEGFADPPVEKKVPKPPILDENYRLWTIELDDVSATLREVWTMEYRYRGEGSLTGGFHLEPKRELWVHPSVVRTHGGVLSLGDRDLLRGSDGVIEADIERFSIKGTEGRQVLRHMTAHVVEHGELVSLGALGDTYFPKDSSASLGEGAGPLGVDIRVERGVVQPDSRVTFHTDAALVKVTDVSLRSDLDFFAQVARQDGHHAIAFGATVAHGTGAPALDVRDARVAIDLASNDLTEPFEVARVSAGVASLHSGDLRGLQTFAPPNFTFGGGKATVAARGDYRRGALDGRVDVLLEKASATIGTFAFVSSGKVTSNVTSNDVDKSIAFPALGADLHDVGLRLMSGHAEGLWLKARFGEANVTTSPPAADAAIEVTSGPGDRTIELFTRLAHLPDIAADVTSGTHLAASLRLRVRPGDISLAVVRANNGPLEGRGRIRKTKGPPTGAFLLSVGPVKAGLDIHDRDVSVAPFVGGDWLDEKLRKR